MTRYSQFSPKIRRSKKLSCKKGGVDCGVSRRERDFRTNHLSSSVLTSSLLFRKAQLNIQSNGKEKNSQEKVLQAFFKSVCEFYLAPTPIIFLQPHKTRILSHPTPHSPSLDNEPQAPRNRRQKRNLFPATSKPRGTVQSKPMRKISILIARSPQAKNSRR